MTAISCLKGDEIMAYTLFFEALSNYTRMAIIHALRRGDKTVSELSRELGFEQSRVSHGLRCLTFCGFVSSRRDGRNRVYSLNRGTVEPILRAAEVHIGRHAQHLLICESLRR